jgi:hypothetical protein
MLSGQVRDAEPHHRVQVLEHAVDLLAWAAVDEVHVAAEPELLAALHHAQHVRDTALRVGTLSGILGNVAAYLRSTRDALVGAPVRSRRRSPLVCPRGAGSPSQ